MKKVNPRRRPATQADVAKARREATDNAVRLAWSIFFTVLSDKEGYQLEDLQRVWHEIEDLSDSIVQGYCNVADLRAVLREEAGVDIQ